VSLYLYSAAWQLPDEDHVAFSFLRPNLFYDPPCVQLYFRPRRCSNNAMGRSTGCGQSSSDAGGRDLETSVGPTYFVSIQLIQYSFHSTLSPAGSTSIGLRPSSITALSSVNAFFPWLASALGCGP